MVISKIFALLCVLVCHVIAASEDQCNDCPITTLKMEGYNNWKLPFAKTLQVKGYGDYEVFPDNYYTTILDPCAYFTVIFVSSTLQTSLPKATIDFNFYGEYGITMTGYWMDLTIKMRDVRDWSEEDFTQYNWQQAVFVANKQFPIRGVEGVMGLALTEPALYAYSAAYAWHTNYSFPLAYMQFLSNQTDEYSHVKGYLSFAQGTNIYDEQGGRDNYYRVAFANFTDQQQNSSAELQASTDESPFMDVEFSLIQATRFTVENVATFWGSDYSDNIFLATFNPQLVIPSQTYTYLNDQFYSLLCDFVIDDEEVEYTEPMYQCACSGGEYYGLPSLQILTKYRYTVEEEFEVSGYMFDMFAEDQELFPVIDKTSRGTICSLAIGNLLAVNGEGQRQSQSFGLGQIFVRKYSLAWNNEILSDGVVETKFYTLKGDPTMTILAQISGFLIFFTFVLAGFVLLTSLKFIRTRGERKVFNRLQELSQDFEIKVSREYQKQMLGDIAGMDYLQGKEDLAIQPGVPMGGQLKHLVSEKHQIVFYDRKGIPSTDRRSSIYGTINGLKPNNDQAAEANQEDNDQAAKGAQGNNDQATE